MLCFVGVFLFFFCEGFVGGFWGGVFWFFIFGSSVTEKQASRLLTMLSFAMVFMRLCYFVKLSEINSAPSCSVLLCELFADLFCVCGTSVRSWCDGSSDRSFMVEPFSYFSFQPVLHDW